MINLNEMKTKELKEMAKELKVKNWWTLKKIDLINEIAFAIGDKEDEGEDVNVDQIAQNAIETANDESTNEAEETTHDDPEAEQNNGWENIAKTQLKNAYNWIVGANENAVNDGEMSGEEFNEWIQTMALKVVYREAISTLYLEDSCGGDAPSEMRFAGKDFCIKYLKKLFKNDGYEVDEPTEKKQRGKDLIEWNGKTQNLSQWAKELGMPGQTLFARIHLSNWSIEKAFTTPVKKRQKKEA